MLFVSYVVQCTLNCQPVNGTWDLKGSDSDTLTPHHKDKDYANLMP